MHNTRENVLDLLNFMYLRFIPKTIIVSCYPEKINVESAVNNGFLNADEIRLQWNYI